MKTKKVRQKSCKIMVIMFLLFMYDIIQSNSYAKVYTNAFVVDFKLHAKY
jgi:hypothetical protein